MSRTENPHIDCNTLAENDFCREVRMDNPDCEKLRLEMIRFRGNSIGSYRRLKTFFFFFNIYAHAKSLQSHLTLYDPTGCILPGSSLHVILWARILRWVAMSSSRDLPNSGLKASNLHLLHCRQITTEPPGKPLLAFNWRIIALQCCIGLCPYNSVNQP